MRAWVPRLGIWVTSHLYMGISDDSDYCSVCVCEFLVPCALCVYVIQRDLPGGLCMPLLCGRQCDAVLPGETVRYLQRVNICESLLLWRQDVDLAKLHHTGKLSLTLLRDGLLER